MPVVLGAVLAALLMSCASSDRNKQPTEKAADVPTKPIDMSKEATPKAPLPPAAVHESGRFFDLLAQAYRNEGAFDPDRVSEWPIAKLDPWLSGDSVAFSDVNQSPRAAQVTREDIFRSLKERSGPVHLAFAHLAHMRTQKYPRYTTLEENTQGDSLVVQMGTPASYRLVFEKSNGRWSLTEFAYLLYDVE